MAPRMVIPEEPLRVELDDLYQAGLLFPMVFDEEEGNDTPLFFSEEEGEYYYLPHASDSSDEEDGYGLEDIEEEEEDEEDGEDTNIPFGSPRIRDFLPTSPWKGWRPPPDARHPEVGPSTEESAPSTSGLGLSRSTEEDYRDSAPPSSPGPGPSTNRTSRFLPFHHEMWSNDILRPVSPRIRDFLPTSPWKGWRPPPDARHPEVGPSSEESAPSTSGLGSSGKRSREESDVEQVSTKRQRFSCEDPAPSTSSGPIFSRTVDYRDSAPPSSPGLGLSRSTEED